MITPTAESRIWGIINSWVVLQTKFFCYSSIFFIVPEKFILKIKFFLAEKWLLKKNNIWFLLKKISINIFCDN